MEIKNKSKKIFFAVLMLTAMTLFGNIGIARVQAQNTFNATEDATQPIKNTGSLESGRATTSNVAAPSENSPGSLPDASMLPWGEAGARRGNIVLKPGEGQVLAEEDGPEEDNACEDASWYAAPFCWLGQFFRRLIFGIIYLFLAGILGFVSMLATIGMSLFYNMIDGTILRELMKGEVIYPIWAIVRDTLNIAFILILLFSAFSTIFQVESYNFRKMLPRLILMAILVNFSYPITRFIVDFSNVFMYYLIDVLGFNDPNTYAIMGTDGPIKPVMDLALTVNPMNITTDNLQIIIACIVFVFVFGVTILVIAVLLLVRAIALALLIIFSPIAFVGSVIPFLSNKASDWWSNLFKYCFFGPIMIFMVYVATEFMKNLSGITLTDTVSSTGGSLNEANKGIIATFALFTIPIAMLWAGIGFAQSLSIAGAGAIGGGAKKFMGKVGKTASGAAFIGSTYKAYKERRAKDSPAASKKLGTWIGGRQDAIQGEIFGGKTGKDSRIRYQNDLTEKVKEESKRNDMGKKGVPELRALSQTGNSYQKAAALSSLAEQGEMEALGKDKLAYDQIIKDFGTDSHVFHDLNGKLKSYDPTAAVSHMASEKQAEALTGIVKGDKFDAKKLSPNSLKDERLMKAMIENNRVSDKDLKEIGEKSTDHRTSIEGSLLANSKNFSKSYTEDEQKNPENKKKHEISQRYNKTLFNQTGKIENDAFEGDVYGNFNKDNASKINKELVTKFKENKDQAKKLVDKLKAKELSSVVTSMKGELANDFFDVVNTAVSDTANATAVQRTAKNSPALAGYRKNGGEAVSSKTAGSKIITPGSSDFNTPRPSMPQRKGLHTNIR